jgi:hypothetical protein
MKGGARSTASALLDVATHPTATIDEIKSLFTHIAAIFSDFNNLGAGLRTHGKAIATIVVKYLPLAGVPGYTAAQAIEKLPIDKFIEVAASIIDFFTGKGDLMHMLTAMGELVGDIWNKLKEIIPQILAKVGHEVSQAIGNSTELTVLANAFGANYESPAVRQAREAYDKMKADRAVEDTARDAANTAKTAAYQTQVTADQAAAKKERQGRYVKAQEENAKTALTKLHYTPEEAGGYGTPQTDMNKIAPVTKKDKEYIEAFLAKTGDDIEKTGLEAPDGLTKKPVLDQAALDKLFQDAYETHTNNDKLWEMTIDPALKAKAYAGDKPSQQLILKYYNRIITPDANHGGSGQYSQAGMQYLATKGVRMAKEELMTDEIRQRMQNDRHAIDEGEQLSLDETKWLKDQEGGYDPRDTAAGKYVFVPGQGGRKPVRQAVVGTGHPFYHMAVRGGKRPRTELLDPRFFEGSM